MIVGKVIQSVLNTWINWNVKDNSVTTIRYEAFFNAFDECKENVLSYTSETKNNVRLDTRY